MLNITKTVENGKAVFTLEGRLDTTTSADLEKALKEIGMSEDDIESLLGDNKGDIPLGPRRAMRSVVIDVVGGDSCIIFRSACGECEFRFDVDENGMG